MVQITKRLKMISFTSDQTVLVQEVFETLILINPERMRFENGADKIYSEITDDESDTAAIFLNGEMAVEYVFGNRTIFPVFINQILLEKTLEILLEEIA